MMWLTQGENMAGGGFRAAFLECCNTKFLLGYVLLFAGCSIFRIWRGSLVT